MYYRLPFHIDGAAFLGYLPKYYISPQSVPSSSIFYELLPHFQMLCNELLAFVSQDTEMELITSLIPILLDHLLHHSLLPPTPSSSALLTSVVMPSPTILLGFLLPHH